MSQQKKPTLQIETIFPQVIGRMENIFLTESEIDFLKQQRMRKNVGNFGSDEQYLFNNPELIKIKTTLESCVNDYFQFVYSPFEYTKIKITQSWFNITKKGEYHHLHQHPNSFLSGCLYIKADKKYHTINFHRMTDNQLLINKSKFTQLNSYEWEYPVETGTVVIFPSYLYHSVPENTREEERISLCFNTFINGSFAPPEHPYGLQLKI